MLKYIAKRLLQMVPVLVIISIIMFGVIKLTPGDGIGYTNPRATAEEKQAERERLGYDKPIHTQYGMWVQRVIKGDFGLSSTYKQPVGEIMWPYIKNSLILNLVVFFLTFLAAIPIGIYTAVKKDGLADKITTVLCYAGISFPTFFIGLVLISIFGVHLKILPISGMVSPGANYTGVSYVLDVAKHMVLPALVLVIVSMPSLIRYVRMSMLNSINEDYVRTARAKGVKERAVIYSHAFRNALINVVTLVGWQIPALFGGAVFLETVFNWPGIGRVLMDSINARDYNLMLALMLMFTFLSLLGNLFADIGYALVDPRVKVE
ncbi:ABC transporter permease [Clostridium sp.]|uniref:ABC transporter permease n=1 Tax=Clostridium sp. TaxID=1506 RepID=UPI0032164968